MKKISLFIGAFALLVAATSSCSSGSNSEPEEPQAPSVKVDVNAENVVTLTSNVDATFTLGTQKVVGKKSATFTTIEKSVVVNVEAEGYLSQDVKVAFGEPGAANVAVTLVKKSTNEVAQDEAKGSTVTNDAANQEATQDVASEVAIEVPADVTVEGSTDPFSITATPVASAEEVTVEEEVSEEKPQEVASPLVAVDCTPSGATFTSPVKLTVSNADIVSDYAFNCVYVKDDGSVETVEATTTDGKVSADVKHFSTWTFNLIAQIVKKGYLSWSIANSFAAYCFGIAAICRKAAREICNIQCPMHMACVYYIISNPISSERSRQARNLAPVNGCRRIIF